MEQTSVWYLSECLLHRNGSFSLTWYCCNSCNSYNNGVMSGIVGAFGNLGEPAPFGPERQPRLTTQTDSQAASSSPSCSGFTLSRALLGCTLVFLPWWSTSVSSLSGLPSSSGRYGGLHIDVIDVPAGQHPSLIPVMQPRECDTAAPQLIDLDDGAPSTLNLPAGIVVERAAPARYGYGCGLGDAEQRSGIF